MGFWDFMAPDFETFKAEVDPYVPDFLPIGRLVLPRDDIVFLAWTLAPSPAGVAVRLLWEAGKAGASLQQATAAANAVNNQAIASPGGHTVIGVTNALAQLIIPNVYRVAVRMTTGGRDIVNVIHVEGTSSGQETAAATAVLAGWKVATGPLTQLSALVAMADVTAMDLSSSSGGIHVITDTTAGGISSVNSLSTRAASALIKLNGGTRSRSTRGRIYYGPVMESSINSDGATLTGTAIGLFTTAFTALKTSLAGASFTLGVASRKTSSFTSAGSVAVETTIATQRRRIRS